MDFDIVLVSDIHLGADVSNGKKFKDFLKYINTKQLILLGDIFQDSKIRRLKRYEWKILTEIRKIMNENNTDVIWVEGNHDFEILDVLSAIVGIDVYERYEFNIQDKTAIAIHGHQFHFHLPKSRLINKLGQSIYLKIQQLDKDDNKHFSKWLDKLVDKITDTEHSVKKGALKYIENNNYDYIFCGHTHKEGNDGKYYNTGAWVLNNCPYIGIKDDKIYQLYYEET